MKTTFVHAPDGVKLAVTEAGPESAPAIVFLHGIAQSRGSWASVLEGPLSRDFRLVSYDLRGHGDSDRPDGADAYANGRSLGDDLASVISTLRLARPLVVAWSYGGVVIGEYLRHHAAEASTTLGGILYIAAAVKSGKTARELYGPTMMNNARALLSDDAAAYAAGARTFVKGCAATPLDPATEDAAVAAMLRVPLHVRRALLGRSEDFSADIAASELPMTTLHGALDSVVLPAMSEAIAAMRAGGRNVANVTIASAGHLPWIEAPAAFEAAVRDAMKIG